MYLKNIYINHPLRSLLFGLLISFSGFIEAAGEEFLDYGLHWVRVENGAESQVKALDDDGNIIPLTVNYYDDSRPTVIYFHGWKSGSSEEDYNRDNFTFSDNGNSLSHLAWKQMGWNVGIYHWNQFADESEVKDAEAKMWSANGSKGMRYRLDDGSYSTLQSPTKSVGEMAFEHITTALANNNESLRFTGLSR